jgi:hypothetical protein
VSTLIGRHTLSPPHIRAWRSTCHQKYDLPVSASLQRKCIYGRTSCTLRFPGPGSRAFQTMVSADLTRSPFAIQMLVYDVSASHPFPSPHRYPPEFSYKIQPNTFPSHHPTRKTSSFATNEGPRRRNVEKSLTSYLPLI